MTEIEKATCHELPSSSTSPCIVFYAKVAEGIVRPGKGVLRHMIGGLATTINFVAASFAPPAAIRQAPSSSAPVAFEFRRAAAEEST